MLDNRLRTTVEFLPAVVLTGLATLLFLRPAAFFPSMPIFPTTALAFVALRCVARLARHKVTPLPRNCVACRTTSLMPRTYRPPSTNCLGRGFRWNRDHSQQLIEARAHQTCRGGASGAERPVLQHARARTSSEDSLSFRVATKLTRRGRWAEPRAPVPPLGGNPRTARCRHGGRERRLDGYRRSDWTHAGTGHHAGRRRGSQNF